MFDRLRDHSLRPFLATLLIVFLVEAFLMGFLHLIGVYEAHPSRFVPGSPLLIGLLDAVLVALVALPFLYFWVFKPFRKEKRRFEELFHGTLHGLIQVDGRGRIERINEVGLELFGYSRDELVGEPVEVLVPEPLRSAHREDRQAFMALPERRPMGTGRELSGVKKDGTEFPVEVGLNPIETRDGQKVIADVTDITERKQTERELRRKERLASMGEMVASITHEINNPNAMIQGNVDFLKRSLEDRLNAEHPEDESLPEEVREALEGIKKGSGRIDRITNNTRQFSRLAGESVEEQEPTPVQSLLTAARSALEDQTEDAPAEIDWHVASPPGSNLHTPISTSELQIILDNLINNSLDALEEESDPRVEVWLEVNRDEDELVLTVRDNGTGIDPETRDRMFEPFYSTKKMAKGTGIGMAVVSGILERCDGELEVDSTPGEGTTIRVRTPVSQTTPEEKPHPEPAGK